MQAGWKLPTSEQLEQSSHARKPPLAEAAFLLSDDQVSDSPPRRGEGAPLGSAPWTNASISPTPPIRPRLRPSRTAIS